MRVWLEMVLDGRTEALHRILGVIAVHAGEVEEAQMRSLTEWPLRRMSLTLAGEIDSCDLLAALLRDPAVRAASVVRRSPPAETLL